MALQKIPLTSSPNQTFTVSVTIDGSQLLLNVSIQYNEMAAYWTLNIADASNNPLVSSIPMITGSYPAANLLQQQAYLNIGAWYVVNVSNTNAATNSNYAYGQGGYGAGPYGGSVDFGGLDYPGPNNLGTDFELWVDDTPTS